MANQEHFDILNQGVIIWNKWIQEHPEIQPDLTALDLSGADLSDANLSGANLSRSRFTDVDFSDAFFSGADMMGANLAKADLTQSIIKFEQSYAHVLSVLIHTTLEPKKISLSGIHFKDTSLSNATFSNTRLIRALLAGAILRDAIFINVDFRRVVFDYTLFQAHLRGANLSYANFKGINLSAINFREVTFHQTNFQRANLQGTDFYGADLSEANLSEANLSGANLSEATLTNTNFVRAYLQETEMCGKNFSQANLSKTDLSGKDLHKALFSRTNLSEANLNDANLSETDLSGANLQSATLVQTNCTRTTLSGCSIYGIAAWNVRLKDAIQKDLVITPKDEPAITVDNLKIAQFIYLLLNNTEIRDAIDTIAKKAILILGRFTPERKAVLDAIKESLRSQDYLPILFDFDKPSSQDLTETVSTLAHLSRFIIVDLTDPSSAPYEVGTIASNHIKPIQALFHPTVEANRVFAMFPDLMRRYHWVLPPYEYQDQEHLLASLQTKVIEPAELKARELEKR